MSVTVCLAMIVRNEAEVLPRCLSAALPHIDAVAIVDTGSEDETCAIIGKFRKDNGLPGALATSEWKGMSASRNEALELAREQGCDYILMLDADDVWEPTEGFKWPPLVASAYEVTLHSNNMSWRRAALMRSDAPWRYEGAAHEYITGAKGPTPLLPGAFIRSMPDGHRRVTEGQSKYDRIAKILEKELERDSTNTRNLFYLAQSYRDGGHPSQALDAYRTVVTAGGWDEEVWYSLLQIASLRRQLGETFEIVCAAYDAAYEARPGRGEPLVEAACYCRHKGRYARGFMYALAAVGLGATDDRLFVDHAVGRRALDEAALCAYRIGRLDVSIAHQMALLLRDDLPDPFRARVESNLQRTAEDGQRVLAEASARPG